VQGRGQGRQRGRHEWCGCEAALLAVCHVLQTVKTGWWPHSHLVAPSVPGGQDLDQHLQLARPVVCTGAQRVGERQGCVKRACASNTTHAGRSPPCRPDNQHPPTINTHLAGSPYVVLPCAVARSSRSGWLHTCIAHRAQHTHTSGWRPHLALTQAHHPATTTTSPAAAPTTRTLRSTSMPASACRLPLRMSATSALLRYALHCGWACAHGFVWRGHLQAPRTHAHPANASMLQQHHTQPHPPHTCTGRAASL
jgi:hypothetical protein